MINRARIKAYAKRPCDVSKGVDEKVGGSDVNADHDLDHILPELEEFFVHDRILELAPHEGDCSAHYKWIVDTLYTYAKILRRRRPRSFQIEDVGSEMYAIAQVFLN